MPESSSNLLDLTAKIVSSHVSRNEVAPSDMPSLISGVYRSLSSARQTVDPSAPAPSPAVPIKKSVFSDYLVCLEDGVKLKMLKRHLAVHFGMTPDQYRTKWGLPRDYPMVAPSYGLRRSEVAKSIGLGRKQSKAENIGVNPSEPQVKPLRARKERGIRG